MRTKPDVVSGVRSDTGAGTVRSVTYEPGNGTRYAVVLSEVPPTRGVDPGILIWVRNYGRAFMLEDGSVSHLSVMRELRCSIFDAVVLAEFIGWATNRRAVSVEEFLKQAS